MTKVSIVMACFNQQAYVAQALDSVLAQTFGDWECIVVDDGSTDDSAGVIRRHVDRDPRFCYLHKENGGVSSARNLGFARARGSYFVPLDADDRLHPRYLEKMVACLSRHPAADLVHCRVKRFGAVNRQWRLPAYSYDRLLWQNMLINSCLFTREAFRRTAGYAEYMSHGFEDWELYIRLLNPQSEVRFVDAVLFFYRVKTSSRSTVQIESGKAEESMRRIYENNRQIYAPLLSNPIGVFNRRLKDFAPVHVARYRRQIAYMHIAYLLVVAMLVGLLVFF